MRLYQIIIQSAEQALSMQRKDGAFPQGCNGPYHDPETPVRNTAHWLIVFSKVYELTGDIRFKTAAKRAVAFLQSPEQRPMGATFWSRKNPNKDFANGLIGQAWAMEGLVTAAKVFSMDELLKLAQDIFVLHPFDEAACGWRIVNVDGSYGPLDAVFNHQLWFAAAGSLILSESPSNTNNKIISSVEGFLDRLHSHLSLYPSGLIMHRGRLFLAKSKKEKILRLLSWNSAVKDQAYMHMKSVGYHGFNLYAMALLKSVYPNHVVWQSPKLKLLLAYTLSEKFKKALKTSKYGYPYNPPGFEVAYGLEIFDQGTIGERQAWVVSQIQRSYDWEKKMMCLNTEDEVTLSARIYEATRLENYLIDIEKV